MTELILQLIFMISLGIIVYIIALAVPRIGEDEIVSNAPQNPIGRWLQSLPLERIDMTFINTRDKILRRMKVWIMKADNFVSRRLNNKENKL